MHRPQSDWDMLAFVHGGDFVITADGQELTWLKGELAEKFEVKTKVLGHDETGDTSAKILDQIVPAVKDAFTYDADFRHAELVV